MTTIGLGVLRRRDGRWRWKRRKPMSRWDELIASGDLIPGTGNFDDLGPPVKLPEGSRPLSEILDEMREDRF